MSGGGKEEAVREKLLHRFWERKAMISLDEYEIEQRVSIEVVG